MHSRIPAILSLLNKEETKSLSITTSALLSFLTVAFFAITIQRVNYFIIYVLSFVLSIQISAYFLADLTKNILIKNVFFVFMVAFCLPGVGTYLLLFEEARELSKIYFPFSFFIPMLLVRGNLYPLTIGSGAIIGYGLRCLELNSIINPLMNNSQLLSFMIQIMIFLLIWKLLYNKKIIELNKKEQDLKGIVLTVSHELTTHFSSLKMNVAHIRQNKDLEKRLKTLERIDQIIKEASFFLEIIKGNFRDHLPKSKSDILDIHSVICELINDYPMSPEQKSLISLSGKSFDVCFDPLHLKHIFYNLLNNSLYFIQKAEKGKITITLTPGSDYNTVSFKDTGNGIKPEHMEFIFERFFSRRKYGTGMGLYFSKEVMEHFKSTISCSSIYGEYTEFILRYPSVKRC